MRAAPLLALLGAVVLGACGGGGPPAPTTALTRALAALRAGNHADFVKAMNDADAAKTALDWQPGMERCQITVKGLQDYGEAVLVDKLDQSDLFKLSEEARFVYAAKIAGQYDAAIAEISMTPMVHDFFAIDPDRHWVSCRNAWYGAGIGYPEGPPGETERRAAFQNWLDTLKARHAGDDFDTAMRNAVAELDRHDFVAAWPAKLQIVDDPGMNHFDAVRHNAGGHGDYGNE